MLLDERPEIPSNLRNLVLTQQLLKGSGRDLGTKRLVEVCQQLEDMGKEAFLGEVPAVLVQVEREFAVAREALEEYLRQDG